MKKILVNFAGTATTLQIIAPGIYIMKQSGLAISGHSIVNQSYPNTDQDDHAGWNILKTANNTVSIQQFNTFATEFAAGEGSFANYRSAQAAADAYGNSTVTFGTIIQQQLG